MTQPLSRISLFVFAHYWLVIALALFGLGFLGITVTASSAAIAASVISISSGVCFFFSVVTLSVWAFRLAREHNLLPALRSTNIKELATKKLLIVLAAVTFFGFSLFWLLFVAALATPLSEPVAATFFPYALGLDFLAVGVIAGIFFLGRNRLLASWFPMLICPHCQEKTSLINNWYCVGGCKAGKPRHVLSPCPTCGTKLQGLACSNYNCGAAISFEESYSEFEVANRNSKYVTQYNPFFWAAVLALELFLLLLYIAFESSFLILGGLFGLTSLGLVITLIVLKPKRLIRNPYYTEGVQQGAQAWTRSATA
jgi:hypothetical protein